MLVSHGVCKRVFHWRSNIPTHRAELSGNIVFSCHHDLLRTISATNANMTDRAFRAIRPDRILLGIRSYRTEPTDMKDEIDRMERIERTESRGGRCLLFLNDAMF